MESEWKFGIVCVVAALGLMLGITGCVANGQSNRAKAFAACLAVADTTPLECGKAVQDSVYP